MTKIQHKRSSALFNGSAKAPSGAQLDYGELAINYSSTDPQFFIKDSSGSVISILSSYAPLSGADFTGNVSFDADVTIKGDSTNGSGKLTLTCEQNTHSVNIKAPAHSASANYTLTLPTSAGSSGEVLSTDGSGGLSWAYAAMYTADKTKLDGIETGATADQTGAEIKALYEAETNAFTDAQFTKLAGIESGATGDQTASEILTLLKTVDGAGSGLDADKLDGISSGSFLRSNANDTGTGVITLQPNANRTLILNRNIATPSNYYNNLQLEVRATDGTAGIGLHRNGYSHVGIYHDTYNRLSFNMSGGTVHVNHNAGTLWGSGNDGSGSGLDADLLDGVQLSRFIYDKNSNLGTTSSWDITSPGIHGVASATAFTGTNAPTGVYTYGHLVTTESQNEGIAQIYFPHTGSSTSKIKVRTGWNNSSWQGWATVWTSNCDGAGSGLDADNLDGHGWDSLTKDVHSSNFYTNGWLYNNQSGEGIYNNFNDTRWASHTSTSWRLRTASGNNCEIQMYPSNVVRGYFYADSTNAVGILDSDHNWMVRCSRDSHIEFRVNNVEYSRINSDYLDHSSDIRAPIFYDSNDTQWYVNPGALSRFVDLEVRSSLDMADGDVLRMGNSDDWTVTYNGNGWNYIDQKQNGIIFRDNGSNICRLEDSGVFRPEATNTGKIGDSSYYWSNGYFQNFNVSGTINVRGALDLADNDILRFGSGDDA